MKLVFVLFILLNALLSAQELLDEDTIFNSSDPIFDVEEQINEDSKEKPHIHSSLESFHRYQHKNERYKSINRLHTRYNNLDLKLLYIGENIQPKSQFGGNITYTPNQNNKLVLGQFQIHHGYGLLLSKSSFITAKPGFNTNYSKHITSLQTNTRPYMSSSFFGIGYQTNFLNNFSLLTFSSYKETGISKTGNLTPNVIDPTDTINLSFSGIILNYKTKNININTNLNYSDFGTPMTTSTAVSYQYYDFLGFSELAWSNAKFANISGIKYQQQRYTQTLAFRYFEPDYLTSFSNYVRNFSSGDNEQGLFYKVSYSDKSFFMQTFADIFSNINNNERYMAKNSGVAWGIQLEKYSLFNLNEMSIKGSYREKHDKEWRNLSGISKLEDRKREYYRLTWKQVDNDNLRTSLTYDYQVKQYPEYNINTVGYTVSGNINLKLNQLKINLIIGVFDTEMPLYLYLYSGRLNNPVYILSGEGNFAMLHISTRLSNNIQIELMGNSIKKDDVEHSISLRLFYNSR